MVSPLGSTTYVHMLVLGILQGIFEWLPVSSKTMVMLYSYFVLGEPIEISYMLGLAIQGGTILAAIAYFRYELLDIVLFRDKKTLMFLIVSTAITGLIGVPLYALYRRLLSAVDIYINLTIVAIGLALLAQAAIQRMLRPGLKTVDSISIIDSMLFGIVQGLAVTPGLSRSGITIALLLYLGYTVEDSLKLSFLASIPANLGATILMSTLEKLDTKYLDTASLLLPLSASTMVSIIVIKSLISFARRYGYKLTASLGLITLVIGLATTFFFI